jgi:hypothetical protein
MTYGKLVDFGWNGEKCGALRLSMWVLGVKNYFFGSYLNFAIIFLVTVISKQT